MGIRKHHEDISNDEELMKSNVMGIAETHLYDGETIDTRSLSVDLDFLENFNFHFLMFLMVYKHVFTRVRLCSSKKSMSTLHI